MISTIPDTNDGIGYVFFTRSICKRVVEYINPYLLHKATTSTNTFTVISENVLEKPLCTKLAQSVRWVVFFCFFFQI